MAIKKYQSWGCYPNVIQNAHQVNWQQSPFVALDGSKSVLAYGKGRSYGDVCLNHQGIVLDTAALDHFISFDNQKGVLCCEAGVTFASINQLIVPQGWFLPVTPGTKYITVGGAIANDVHGKNHHVAGSFGCYLTKLNLLRSSGEQLPCSAELNSDLFYATIGGLGLTGLIVSAEFALKKIQGPFINQKIRKFTSIDEFFSIINSSDKDSEYSVAWVDCLAQGKVLGRGLYITGNHESDTTKHLESKAESRSRMRLGLPINLPGFVLNGPAIKAFNVMYFHKHRASKSIVHYDSFFYPLDRIAHWNRMYGRKGFVQYQCVIPMLHAETAIVRILQDIAQQGSGSFLSVLKKMGSRSSAGMLSFPRPGITLALDFPLHSSKTFALLDQLDDTVVKYGGAIYPAKDARMSAAVFQQCYPQWQSFGQYIDPEFSSSFWRRVTANTPGAT